MHDDDEEEYEIVEDDGVEANWVDYVQAALQPVVGLARGVYQMFASFDQLLGMKSKSIDRRKEMSNAVHEAIEEIARGEGE